MSSGAFGSVFAATEKQSGTKVAIKVLHKTSEKSDNEIYLMRSIVKDGHCLDSFVCYIRHMQIPWPNATGLDRKYAIVMSFVPGQDLYDYMEQFVSTDKHGRTVYRPIDLQLLKKLFGTALQGLAALHDNSIAHRDVKPENLRVVDNERIVFLDLGLSCFGDSRTPSCESTGTFGTPCYTMSPQRAAMRGASNLQMAFSDDVYALAMTFYPLFTGFDSPACILTDAMILEKEKTDETPSDDDFYEVIRSANVQPLSAAQISRHLTASTRTSGASTATSDGDTIADGLAALFWQMSLPTTQGRPTSKEALLRFNTLTATAEAEQATTKVQQTAST